MDGKPGLQNPGAGEEGKITRRQLVAGVVVLGGLGVLAYLYGDRLGMGCDCTCDLFTSKPPTTTPQTSTPSTSTSLAADLIGPDFPVHDIRPYLAIKPVGLTHMGAGADILDVFLANDGYGPSMAFFEIYKWHSLPRTVRPPLPLIQPVNHGRYTQLNQTCSPLLFPTPSVSLSHVKWSACRLAPMHPVEYQ
jgi:hypothetical protein